MGYRRGYDCDICGEVSENEDDFLGFEVRGHSNITGFVVDSADFHVCLHCADMITCALVKRDAKEPTP